MFHVGWSKQEITGLSFKGYAMMGWGMWDNRAVGQTTPLYARSFCITDSHKNNAIICCLDLGYITYAMRSGVVAALKAKLSKDHNTFNFNEDALVMTATHTHSGPGGCAHESLYNVVTPGYLPDHVEAIVNATVSSIIEAIKKQQVTEICFSENVFADNTEVAWNRSLSAYNENPDVISKKAHETHLAIDRNMRVLRFERNGKLASFMSIFGVHATCVGNTHSTYNGDNKGYAAVEAEKALYAELSTHNTEVDLPVAMFAQGTAGDVSPYFHGKNDVAKRAKLKKDDQVTYAKHNAHLQTVKAMEVAKSQTTDTIQGSISSVLAYFDFSNVKSHPNYAHGKDNAYTGDPCIGVSMFVGTRVDGPGMPQALGLAAKNLARTVKKIRLSPISLLSKTDKAYYKRLYSIHGKKDILMEGERKLTLGSPLSKILLPGFVDPTLASIKQQALSGALTKSPMVPTVLPLQIIRVGQLAFVCCPGEFTTVSGKRVKDTVQQVLAEHTVEHVIILSYCNEYMGYVTTNEEYQLQHYEAGHTLYGQWTQAGFQTKFAELAKELTQETKSDTYKQANELRPKPVPLDELALRTNIKPPRKW